MKELGVLALVIVLFWYMLRSKGQKGGASPSSASSGITPYTPLSDSSTGNDALDNIMQAIFRFEGGKASDRNVVNNNPGNLRSGVGMTGTAGGYATYADVGDGWEGLQAWVVSHANAHPEWDFYDMFSYYLGGGTGKLPEGGQAKADQYADYVASYGGFDPTQSVWEAMGMQ